MAATNWNAAPSRCLRFGLRLALYLILFLAIALAANQLRAWIAPVDSPPLLADLAFAGVFISGTLLLTAAFRRWADRQPFSALSLRFDRLTPHRFVFGAAWAPLLMPAPLLVLAAAVGQLAFAGTEVSVSGFAPAALYLLAGALNAFTIAFCEELALRGYVFHHLGSRFPLWLAALLNGLIFGLMHFWNGVNLNTVLTMAGMSLVFVTLRLSMRSVWAAIGLHAAYNWTYTSAFGFSSGEDPAYGHALLHFTVPGQSAAAATANPWLGDIDVLLPYTVCFGLVILGILAVNRVRRRSFHWGSKLDENGIPIGPNG